MMETARSKALKSLTTSMPVANQAVAQGMQQARLLGLQRAVASTTAPAQKSDIQQGAAQQVQQAGQIQNQTAQATQQQLGQVAQAGLTEQARADSADLGQRKLQLQKTTDANDSELSQMDRNFRQRIFDRRSQFQVDESGRATMNEYQLADWAVDKAKSQEDLANKLQTMKLVQDRKIQLLQIAHQKIADQLAFEEKKSEQDRDQATMEKLMQDKHDLELQIQKEQADAANKQAMYSAGGAVLLGAAGGVVGGPAGAMVGASAGQAAGSLIASTLG